MRTSLFAFGFPRRGGGGARPKHLREAEGCCSRLMRSSRRWNWFRQVRRLLRLAGELRPFQRLLHQRVAVEDVGLLREVAPRRRLRSRLIATWPRRSSPPPIPTSRWSCTCRPRIGTASSRCRATEDGPDRFRAWRDAIGPARGLRDLSHRHRPLRRGRHVRAGPSRKNHRLRLSSGA